MSRSGDIPCTTTIFYGVSRYSASVCTAGGRELPSDCQWIRRIWTRTSPSTVIGKLVVVGPTSTVDHGAFPAGSPERRTTTSRIPPTIPHRSNAEQQGWRWQAATTPDGAEEVSTSSTEDPCPSLPYDDRSGKSSISSVVFHKLPPSETLYLETTYRIKKESMQYANPTKDTITQTD